MWVNSYESVQNIKSLLTPFVLSVLENKPDNIVVSGSIILDAIFSTNFANDIDIFCTENAGTEILKLAKKQNIKTTVCYGCLYVNNTLERYRIMDTKPIDLIIVSCSPLDSVDMFDMSHNKIAFDGESVHTHAEWNCCKQTSTNYSIDEITKYMGTSSYGKDPKFDRTLGRIVKYANRKYQIFDCNGEEIMFTEIEKTIIMNQTTDKQTIIPGVPRDDKIIIDPQPSQPYADKLRIKALLKLRNRTYCSGLCMGGEVHEFYAENKLLGLDKKHLESLEDEVDKIMLQKYGAKNIN